MIGVMRSNWGSISSGVALGVLIAIVANSTIWSFDDIFCRLYDEWFPVATIEAKKQSAPVGEIRALLTVQRHRGECVFTGPAAFEVLPDGTAVRVFAARVDALASVNLAHGMKLVAEWRFWPIGIGNLIVWMDYQCDGRLVRVPVRGLQ